MEPVSLRQQAAEALVDVRHQVEADEVDEAENAGLRDAERPAHHGIRLFDRQLGIHRVQHRHLQPVDAEPVGDEAGAVVAGDDALAHRDIGEGGDFFDHRRVGLRPGDDLQQPHVARRVEEMGNQKVFGKSLRTPFDQRAERDGGGVRRHRRAGLAHRIDLGIERLLHVEALQHDLDDPVAIGELLEIVVDIADLDQLGVARRHQRRRLCLEHPLDGAARHRRAVLFVLADDVEQQHRHAGIRHLRRDARAHDARADHRDFLDLVLDRAAHHTRSMIVAMPWPPPIHCVASA